VIGFLAVGANGPNRWGASFYQGLKLGYIFLPRLKRRKDVGYVEGQNVAAIIESMA
jgi:hypothetical protein